MEEEIQMSQSYHNLLIRNTLLLILAIAMGIGCRIMNAVPDNTGPCMLQLTYDEELPKAPAKVSSGKAASIWYPVRDIRGRLKSIQLSPSSPWLVPASHDGQKQSPAKAGASFCLANPKGIAVVPGNSLVEGGADKPAEGQIQMRFDFVDVEIAVPSIGPAELAGKIVTVRVVFAEKAHADDVCGGKETMYAGDKLIKLPGSDDFVWFDSSGCQSIRPAAPIRDESLQKTSRLNGGHVPFFVPQSNTARVGNAEIMGGDCTITLAFRLCRAVEFRFVSWRDVKDVGDLLAAFSLTGDGGGDGNGLSVSLSKRVPS